MLDLMGNPEDVAVHLLSLICRMQARRDGFVAMVTSIIKILW